MSIFNRIFDGIQNKRFPLDMVIFKEVGGSVPRIVITRAKIVGNTLVTKEGFIQPRFDWSNQVSDFFHMAYWKSNSNIYPIVLEKKPETKLRIKRPFIERISKKKGVGIWDQDNDITELAKKVTDKKGNMVYVSTHHTIVFPKENVELKTIFDDSIRPTLIEMFRASAKRYTKLDWLSKHQNLVVGFFFLCGMALFMVFAYGLYSGQADAIAQGIKVEAEIACKIIEQTIPTITPKPTLPGVPPALS